MAQHQQNVQVVVRCRPLNQTEIQEKQAPVAKVDEATKEVTIDVKSRNLTKTFTYDAVYGPSASQRDLYNGTVLPIVQEVLDGYNCTIFAYGQTGTGKTYTMEGNRDTEDTSQLDSKARLKASREAGIISRAINTIFEHLSKSSDEYSVKVSHLELYNEELYDLLDPDNKGLKILEDPANPNASITVRGLTESNVYNPRDIFNVLEKSWLERTTAETKLNKESSRSHCIFSITIHMKERNIEGEDLLKVGKLNLVDLAGSENVGKSGMAAKTAGRQEAGMINKSLLAFGRVITALVDQAPHTPYRESKLTRILQDSLGGKTRTCIVATISPASVSLDETIGTLEYAHRARSIKNQPQVNAKLSKKEFLGDYAREIDDMRSNLDAMRRKEGVWLPKEQHDQLLNDLSVKGQEVEALLEEKKAKEKAFEVMHHSFDQQAAELKDNQSALQDTQGTLDSTILELNDTLSTLEATRLDLAEHKTVANERIQTEATFHLEANQVMSTLNQSLKDHDALRAKIGRQEELAALNNANWFDLRDDLVRRIKKNEQLLHSFVAAQSSKYGDLDRSVKKTLSEKENEAATSLDRVRELTKLVEDDQKKLANLVNVQTEEAKRQSNYLRSLQTAHGDAVAKQLGTLSDVIDGRVNTLVTTITSYEQRTRSWCDARETDLKETVVGSHNYTESQISSSIKLRDETKALIDKEIVSYAENRAKLADFIQKQKGEVREFQAKLIESMTAMLASYVAEKEAQLDGVMQTFEKSFDERVTEIAAFRGATATLESLTDRVNTYAKDSASKKAATLDNIKKMGEIAAGISKINVDQARQINTASSSEASKIKETNRAYLKGFEAHVSDALVGLEKNAEVEKAALLEMVTQTSTAASELSDGIRDGLSSLKSAKDGWSQALKARGTDGANFESSYNADTAALAARMVGFESKKYTPIGATPVKKSWSYPSELTHTRPDADIVAQYRAHGDLSSYPDPLREARKIAEAALKSLKDPSKEADTPADLASDGAETSESSSPLFTPAPVEPEVEEPQLFKSAAVAEKSEKASENKPTMAPPAAQKPKPKPLAPSNTAARPAVVNKNANAANMQVNRVAPGAKPGLAGRENPVRPANAAASTTGNASAATTSNGTAAKPMLKRTNSQQQIVTAQVRSNVAKQ